MCNLAGDHVHLVVQRHGDDHVGLLGSCCLQHFRMRSVTDKATHIECIANLADQFRRRVDHRHVVFLRRKPLGNAVADATAPANDDTHPSGSLKRPATSVSCARRSVPYQ